MEKMRNSYWDNMKLVLIFLVVLGHFLLPVSPKGQMTRTVYFWIYSFHMPAFIFVSGYFSKNYVNERRKEEKLAGFLALYLLFTVSIWIIRFVFGKAIGFNILLSTSGAPWYMLAMFFWYLLIPFVSRIKPVIAFTLFFSLGLLVGLYKACGNFLVLSRAIVFFPFFLVGYYFDGSLINRIKPWMRLFAASLLILWALILFVFHDYVSSFLKVISANSSYYSLGLSGLYGVVFRFFWYLLSAAMIMALMILIPSRRFSVTYIGERTLGIYIIHRLLRDVFNNLGFYRFMSGDRVVLLSCILISVLIVYSSSAKPISLFLKRFFHLDFIFCPVYSSEFAANQTD